MGGKTAIALGLVAGLVVGGLIVGGVIALAPAAPPNRHSPRRAGPLRLPGAARDRAALRVDRGVVAGPCRLAAPPATEDPSGSSAAEAFGIGEPAPPLVLPRLGGGTVDLADYRGKPVWVNFMATWCPSCVDELPVGLDSDGEVSAEWGAIALPATTGSTRTESCGTGRWAASVRTQGPGSRDVPAGGHGHVVAAGALVQPARSSHASRTSPTANTISSTARSRIVHR